MIDKQNAPRAAHSNNRKDQAPFPADPATLQDAATTTTATVRTRAFANVRRGSVRLINGGAKEP
ncbi:MAG: hypothetical protein CM15mP120_22040 [Pseudomonadota bacterium]|nr:MAG: hypothetical protein CM15mP120_22040 [Pseudomonadota bacterium]